MKLFNLLWLSVAGVVGASYLAQANPRQPPPQPKKDALKPWKVQPVAMPVIARSAHQALLARQNQLAGKTFSCDGRSFYFRFGVGFPDCTYFELPLPPVLSGRPTRFSGLEVMGNNLQPQ